MNARTPCPQDSPSRFAEPDRPAAHYVEAIDRIIVETESDRVQVTVAGAAVLMQKLAVAVMDGRLARGSTAGEGVWLTANWFAEADAVAQLWAARKAVA